MDPLFNEPPEMSLARSLDGHAQTLASGYAAPVSELDGATVLAFASVEDHVDGNGWVALWLVEGQGVFYLDGEATALKKGDVVMFDDNVEHGFESEQVCWGLNFCLGSPKTTDELKKLIQDFKASAPKPAKRPKL